MVADRWLSGIVSKPTAFPRAHPHIFSTMKVSGTRLQTLPPGAAAPGAANQRPWESTRPFETGGAFPNVRPGVRRVSDDETRRGITDDAAAGCAAASASRAHVVDGPAGARRMSRSQPESGEKRRLPLMTVRFEDPWIIRAPPGAWDRACSPSGSQLRARGAREKPQGANASRGGHVRLVGAARPLVVTRRKLKCGRGHETAYGKSTPPHVRLATQFGHAKPCPRRSPFAA